MCSKMSKSNQQKVPRICHLPNWPPSQSDLTLGTNLGNPKKPPVLSRGLRDAKKEAKVRSKDWRLCG